ncbi:protein STRICTOSIDINE SYNTHASE-LIKE 10-like [Momordica charantia]|uniref:Protein STRICTOSIDINE SYNTHASE-LIKE 10-like n=1 Tax=Momordica charantia TaxID=3673 RepID=A0A6J1CYI8_MOMCH|nr:protein STRICTOSIDINE SYNTHASE-LIKE 10-like [Momordica charantia]
MKISLGLSSSSFLLFLSMVTVSWTPLEAAVEQWQLPGGVFGPESIAFDCHGEGPYAGVGDGRILKWKGADLGWTHFAVTSPNREGKECDGLPETEVVCGRPLGIKFHPSSCELYIADAYFGLLVVGPHGGLAHQLASSAQGVPFRFTNALDIDPSNGVVYFTDSSTLFQRRVWLLSIMNGDKTGRLLKYDPGTRNVTVLMSGLAFPNGVALSKDGSFLVMAETGTMQILKLWVKGPKSGTAEKLAQLDRFPDNVKRTDGGDFWIAMNSLRGKLEAETWPEPGLGADPVAVKMDGGGAVKAVVDGEEGAALDSVSEVEERTGRLWIGSAVKPYVGVIIN